MLTKESQLQARKARLQEELSSEVEGSDSAFKLLLRIAACDVKIRQVHVTEYTYDTEEQRLMMEALYNKAVRRYSNLKAFLATL